MPKLRAMHYSHVGHKDARLDGVSVPFTDEITGEPTDTIVWLRNGGGKTSQIQLKFSLFVPDRKEFIGRIKGSTRSFEQYFQPNETGLIVSEWDLGPDVNTRIIGQCVRIKPDGDLDRLFFSFSVPRDGSGIGVDMLPMRQFQSETNPGYTKDVSSFLTMLKGLFQSRPELDLFTTKVQHEWLTELRKWGFNPDLYRMLLRLNVGGGKGDSMLDKISSTEKFIGLICDLLIDNDGLADLKKIISKHREQLRMLPDLRREHELFETLKSLLGSLVEPGKELNSAEKELSSASSSSDQVASRICATEPSLTTCLGELETEKEDLTGERNNLQTKIDNSNNLESWVEYFIAREGHDDAMAIKKLAEKSEVEAQSDFDLLRAVVLATKIIKEKHTCAGLIKAIEDASAPADELFCILNNLGVALDIHYVSAIDENVKNLKDTDSDLVERKKVLAEVKTITHEKRDSITRNNTLTEGITVWLDKATKEKNRLVAVKCFTDNDETFDHAFHRINCVLHTQQSELGSCERERSREESNKGRLAGEIVKSRTILVGFKDDFDTHCEDQRRFFLAQKNVSGLEKISDLLEDDDYSPYIPGLESQIETSLDDKRRLAEALNTDHRRLNEALTYTNHNNGLLPPQEDVVKVVEALKAQGIPAVPYVEYLDEDKIEISDARTLLGSNPARYGGVYITSARHLKKAKELLATLPLLRGPVQVSVHCGKSEWDQADDCFTVLPDSNATFNRLAAADEMAGLVAENKTIAGKINTINTTIKKLDVERTKLSNFLHLYPQGTEDSFLSKIEEADRKKNECTESIESLTGQLAVSEAEITGIKEREQGHRNQLDVLKRNRIEVQNYEKTYGSLLQEQRDKLEQLKGDIKQATTTLVELYAQQKKLDGEIFNLEILISRTKKLLSDNRASRESITYRDENKALAAKEQISATLEEILPRYKSAKDNYDLETTKVDPIRAKLEAREEILTALHNEFATTFSDFDATRVTTLSEERIEKRAEVQHEEITSAEHTLSRAKHSSWEAGSLVDSTAEIMKTAREGTVGDEPATVDFDNLTAFKERLHTNSALLSGIVDNLETKINTLGCEIDDLKKDSKGIILLVRMVKSVSGQIVAAAEPFVSLEECRREWDEITVLLSEKTHIHDAKRDYVDELKLRIETLFNEEKFKGISENLKRRVLDNKGTLHSEAETFRGEAADRLASISHSLETADEHRMTIVNYLNDYAESTKTNLEYLQKVSTIPPNNETWARWSNIPFFEVKINNRKLKEGYGLTNIEHYVNSLLETKEDNIPSDAAIIAKSATIAALRGVTTISTLKPTTRMILDRCDLKAVNDFSDGEKLEFTLLAYMMIARLVSGANGTGKDSGNILLVDNPIGECSLTSFIELQRMVAKILNTQLIYPTALNDFSIISMFPHVVSLKNERCDRRTGHQYVEVERVPRPGELPKMPGMAGISRSATLDVTEEAIRVKGVANDQQ